MDFVYINKGLNAKFEEITKRIFRLQNGWNLESIERIGGRYDNQVGASFLSLKNLASNYSEDKNLSLLLWNTKKREEQVVACFLLPPNCINKEKIQQLLETCYSTEIAEFFGTYLIAKREDFEDIVYYLIDSKNQFSQVAALTAISRNRIYRKDDSFFTNSRIMEIERELLDDRFIQMVFNRLRLNFNI